MEQELSKLDLPLNLNVAIDRAHRIGKVKEISSAVQLLLGLPLGAQDQLLTNLDRNMKQVIKVKLILQYKRNSTWILPGVDFN